MADVGVLNLKVNAEGSDKATQSLRQLAGALYRVKNAVSGGIHLGNVGKQIQDLAVKVDAYIGKGTISKINQLGEALQRLKNVGNLSNVTINIKDGNVTSVKSKVDQLKDTIDNGIFTNANKDARIMSAGLEETKVRSQELQNKLEEGIYGDVEEQTKTAVASIKEYENEIDNLKKEIDMHKDVLGIGILEKSITDEEADAICDRIIQIENQIGSLQKKIKALSVTKLLEQLNNPSGATSYKYFNEYIDRLIGIDDNCKKAKDSAKALDELLKKQEAESRNNPVRKAIESNPDRSGENERLRNLKNAVYTYATEDFYKLPKGSDNPGFARPTDLNSGTPQAWALLGLLGEKQQIAAMTDEVRGTGQTLEEVKSRIDEAKASMGDAMPVVNGFRLAVAQINEQAGEKITADNLVDMSQADLLTMKMNGMKDALQADISENKLSAQQMAERAMQIQKLSGQIDRMREKQEGATEETHRFRDALAELKKHVNGTYLGKLASQFMRMARMRAIRYVIREISAGFSEGLKNVYEYSNAINGSFASAMDNASSSLLQMKNSLGAAVAPLVQMLVPVLQTLVSWFITLVNYANQFFALMNGQATWTHAVPATADAFEDQANAAQGASAAVKDLLADWDELNIIQSETGGGGGGAGTSAAEEYLNMFEEVGHFENRIKDIVNFIKDNFEQIKKIALEIGAALLTWKVSTLLSGLIGDLFGIAAAGLTAKIIFDVVTMFDEQYIKTGNAGWLVANLLTTLLGYTLMNKILNNVLGGEFAKLSLPITLAVSATADIATLLGNVDTSALGKENIVLAALASIKTGGMLAYLFRLSGMSALNALKYGGVGAIMTFGAVIGLKTVVRAAHSGVTEEEVKSAALSSLSLGIGAGLLAKLTGATALGALGAGALTAGLAVLTLTAAIGLATVLSVDKKKIAWGNISLSEKEIQSFVNDKMFSVDVKATITSIKATVDDIEKIKNEIQQGITDASVPLNLVKLGLATEETYQQLSDELLGEGGVISRLQEYAKKQSSLIELSYTLMPVTGEDGTIDKEATAKAITDGTSGWTEVEGYMRRIGTQLADALKGSTKDGLTTYDDELIAELTEKLNNVQKAVTGAQISSNAAGNLLNGLTGKSAAGVIEQFNIYKEELRSAYEDILKQELSSYRSLEAFYLARGEEGDAERAEYYANKAKKLVDIWNDRLNASVETASQDGKSIIRESLMGLLTVNPEDIATNVSRGAMDPLVQTMLNSLGIAIRNSDGAYTDEVKNQMSSLLDSILQAVLTEEDYNAFKNALGSGAVGYADFFTDATLDKIIGMIGNKEYYGPAIRKAFAELGIGKIVNEAMQESIDESGGTSEGIADTVADKVAESAGISGGTLPDIEYSAEVVEDPSLNEPISAPGVDNTEFNRTINERVETARQAAIQIQDYLSMMGGFAPMTGPMSGYRESARPVIGRAAGGAVRSGDLVMANENGNFEMMGRMGHQPVVANNQQIVDGISRGVTNANGNVVTEMRTMVTLMQRLLNKEIVAKAVPSSGWGRNNSKSAEAYSKVTG